MTVKNRLGELIDTATADVPPRFLSAPVSSIRSRVRRRRNASIAVITAALVAIVLVGGGTLGQGTADPVRPTEPSPTTLSTTDGVVALPWASAMVSRDGKTITVQAGPNAPGCKELVQPMAKVAATDDKQVAIAVTGRLGDAADCSRAKTVPMVVMLGAPLGDRALIDATTQRPHPIYFERDLPDMRAKTMFTPYPTTASQPEVWEQGYNGPTAEHLLLAAASGPPGAGWPTALSTITLGSHKGAISFLSPNTWIAMWEASGTTYSLRFQCPEDRDIALDQFEHLLLSLLWI